MEFKKGKRNIPFHRGILEENDIFFIGCKYINTQQSAVPPCPWSSISIIKAEWNSKHKTEWEGALNGFMHFQGQGTGGKGKEGGKREGQEMF